MSTCSSSVKQEFLKKWIKGVQISRSLNKNMSLLERKNAIKLSANVAMASTKNGSTSWSRALLANASEHSNNAIIVRKVVGSSCGALDKVKILQAARTSRGKRILNKSCGVGRVRKRLSHKGAAKSIAKRLVKKRTRVLKGIVPGGQFLDDITLIEEALDYIISLRAQVNEMQCVVTATEQARNA